MIMIRGEATPINRLDMVTVGAQQLERIRATIQVRPFVHRLLDDLSVTGAVVVHVVQLKNAAIRV